MATSIMKIFRVFGIKGLNLHRKYIFFILQRCHSRYVTKIDPLPTRYGGKTNVTILPGSGVGPEIMECALRVLRAAGAPLSYEILKLSSIEEASDEFENALTSIRRNRVALKGNIEIQSKDPYISSRNVLLRKTLDLYAYVLSCKTYPGLMNKFGEIDIIVVRQNTEGEYLMLEHEPVPGSVESLKVITKFNSERLAEYAFNYALSHNRKKITVVHDDDEALFLEAVTNVSKKYPAVQFEILEVGVSVIKLISNPTHFDIILATNLNGSMVSNYLNGMCGGPGLIAGTNFGDNGIAVFEPGARNKGSSIVGRGIANPIAMIMAGMNLLDHLGYHKTSETIRQSVYETIVHDQVRSPDMGGKATSLEITDAIIGHIVKKSHPKNQGKTDQLRRQRWKTYCDVPDEKHPK